MKSTSIESLQPTRLWQNFSKLNAVPRPSKAEARVTQFMVEFGKGLGLETAVDGVGNVLIRKPATAGREAASVVVLQSHLDMVHQKNTGTDFDFSTQGINMFLDGDWVRAEGTTLGADNGIGVAAMMAILESNDIEHPPIEALFTIDEETGMTGAKALQDDWLRGRILLNLDTEDDTELTIGCAGGMDVTGQVSLDTEPPPAESTVWRLVLQGLTGGHSGMDIHLGRANSNKLMSRLVSKLSERVAVRLAEFSGGSLRNAIPREAQAIIAFPRSRLEDVKASIAAEEKVLQQEYCLTDPGLTIGLFEHSATMQVLTAADQSKILRVTDAIPNGIFRMSPAVAGLVQTSNNLAKVTVSNGRAEWCCLTRSSVDSERHELGRVIRVILEGAGAAVEFASDYPGWQPNPDSRIVALMRRLYQEEFASEPHVAACHAGLECGIIGAHYPGMEMISFGPNIRGAHSPDEQVQVSSVQKFWQFLLKTLAEVR